MRWGVYVLCTFAAIWAAVALRAGGAPLWTLVLPPAASLLVVLVTLRLAGPAIDRPRADPERATRALAWASGIEGVAIFLAANFAITLGRPDLVTPAVALVIGLHFLALARFMPQPVYYVTGAALIAIAVAGMALAPTYRDVAVGAAAALTLWATALSYGRVGHSARS